MEYRVPFYMCVTAVGIILGTMSGSWWDYIIGGVGLGMLVYIFLEVLSKLENKE